MISPSVIYGGAFVALVCLLVAVSPTLIALHPLPTMLAQ